MKGKNLNSFGKTQCACCGCFTISEIGETCPVCYWEENIYQEGRPDDDDAPNYISLQNAKEFFLKYGAKNKKLILLVRKPHVNEFPPKTGGDTC